MTTVTTDRLKKKFAEVTQELVRFPTGNSVNGTNSTSSGGDDTNGCTLTVEKIIKVQGDYMITEQGSKAQLFCPQPCTFWKCTGTPDSNGVITLQRPLNGLFISDGSNTYCLGVSGASSEFEVRFHVADNEIRMNSMWLNIQANHIVKNGLEED